MKRSGRLQRKTPLRANPKKVQEWKDKSRQKPMKQRSKKRAKQERAYSPDAAAFIKDHPTCPVFGTPTTDVHHSAKRYGKWLNLKRYWIAVSRAGHDWIEQNKAEAEKRRLMVRISETYDLHVSKLWAIGITDLDRPIYYQPDEGAPRDFSSTR
jgi:hypothetical protein